MAERQLLKSSRITKREIRNIRNLIKACWEVDRFAIRLYWNIIHKRDFEDLDDLLYYIDGKLVAYFAIFVFKDNEAELSAMVHPDFRQQGLFKILLREAAFDLQRRNIKLCQLICDSRAEAALDFAKKHGGKYSHSEIEMELKHKIKDLELPDIEMRLATEDEIQLLAQMDADAFDTDLDDMAFRFREQFPEKNRTAFIASHNGVDIGKTHIRVDDVDTAFIHDLCVPPKFQRKGYACAMVMELNKLLKKKGYPVIALDVLADNTSAIKLYEKCGYELTAEHKFYNVSTTKLLADLK